MVWSRLDLPTPLLEIVEPAHICARCSVILWDWVSERLVPKYVLGEGNFDVWLVRDQARLRIWSNPLNAARKLHWWYFGTRDADRLLDFLTRPD